MISLLLNEVMKLPVPGEFPLVVVVETSPHAPVLRLAEQPLIAEAAKLLITSTVCTLYDDLTASVPLFPFKMSSLSHLSVLSLPR